MKKTKPDNLQSKEQEWEKEFDEKWPALMALPSKFSSGTGGYDPRPYLKDFICDLIEKEKLAERERCAEIVRVWHKEHCDCKPGPLGFDLWHHNAATLETKILNPKSNERT